MMDDFLRDIHVSVFKQWILSTSYDDVEVESQDSAIILKTKYGLGEIMFHDKNIIELSVMNIKTGNAEFYLHFQLNNLEHAKELYLEMVDALRKLINQPIIKVLLSCTSGLTTGFFAEKLNEAIEILNMPYHIDAVPYAELFETGNQYDVIYLAPQVSFLESKVKETLKNKKVFKISPQIFAKYDVKMMLNCLEEDLQEKKEYLTSLKNLPNAPEIKSHESKILTMFLLRNSNRVHIINNLYDKNNHHILTSEIMKPEISIDDIYDVLDTIIAQHYDIEMIGLILPGVINDGFISSAYIKGLNNQKLKEIFEDKYDKNFIYINDINAAAMGYYASNDDYQNVSYIFQPLYYTAGTGHIVNGKLIKGAHNIAGELKFAPLGIGDLYKTKIKTPEGALDVVAKMVASIISVIDPELIGISAQLLTDEEELINEVSKYVPREYIPEIRFEDYMHLYVEYGSLILCANACKTR